MSALKFLSKKSWHTANIKNSEKVWLKEREEATEKSRIDELRKQIEEERKQQEAEELEIKAGRLDPEHLLKRRRINWMYEFGPSQTKTADKEVEENEREDILTGKKEVTLRTLEKEQEKGAPSMIDIENKMREDPLLDIKRQRMQITREQHLRKLYGERESHSTDRAERLKRKQYRQAIREERRRKREARRPPRSEISTYAKNYKNEEQIYHSPRVESTGTVQRHCTGNQNEYGLQLPERDSRVAVTKRFVPRRKRFDQPPPQYTTRPPHRRRFDEAPADASTHPAPRRRFDQAPSVTNMSERRTTDLANEHRATMLEQMRLDAEKVDIERKITAGEYETKARGGGFESRKRRFGE